MSRAGKSNKAASSRSIVLVGMMGAGKTTLGRRLAPRLGLPFADVDAEIETAAGMTVAELFAAHGEASFREGEARVIARLLSGPPQVIASGGGAILHEGTRRLMKARAISIWIKADAAVLAKRATRRDVRPLLRDGDPEATLRSLLETRAPFYAEADIHLDSRPGPHGATVDAIIEALDAHRAREGLDLESEPS